MKAKKTQPTRAIGEVQNLVKESEYRQVNVVRSLVKTVVIVFVVAVLFFGLFFMAVASAPWDLSK